MKVLTNFKDYYDSGLGYGQDPKIVYRRFKKEMEWTREEAHKDPLLRYLWSLGELLYSTDFLDTREVNDARIAVESRVIGFCGKLYVAVSLEHHHRPGPGYYENGVYKSDRQVDKSGWLYESVFVENWLQNLKTSSSLEALIKLFIDPDDRTVNLTRRMRSDIKRGIHHRIQFSKRDFEFYLDGYASASERLGKQVFEHFKVPVFIVERPYKAGDYWHGLNVVLNPRLEDYAFYRRFDSQQAYQEISMWVGNNLFEPPEMVTISDVDMRDKKGFDKWSFKTPPKEK